jgi:spore maturation protein CgeB
VKIDIVFPEFFSWTWNYSFGMVRAAKDLGVLNKYINLSICSENDILSIGDTSADLIIFFGGVEHSARLFDSENKRETLKSVSIPKVAILVESLEYDSFEVAMFPTLADIHKENLSRCELFSHLITSDEADLSRLRTLSPSSVVRWLPQCADTSLFYPQDKEKVHELVFIGSLYPRRQLVLDKFKDSGVKVEAKRVYSENNTFVRSSHNGPLSRKRLASQITKVFSQFFCRETKSQQYYRFKHRDTNLLNALINEVKLNVNFPGPHRAFTSRVFEVMATRGVLIQPIPKNRPLSMSLFEDMKDIVYYEASDPSSALEKIGSLINNPIACYEIGSSALNKIQMFHTCKRRLTEIIEIAMGKSRGPQVL